MKSAVIGSFQKLDPRYMIKIRSCSLWKLDFFITLVLTVFPRQSSGDEANLRVYNGIVTVILFVTILFANFAESVAEGRGKAQAENI